MEIKMATWTKVEDGEYNEYQAEINGWDAHVYSDRDEQQWHYTIDDGNDSESLDADNLYDAQREAETEIKRFAGHKKQ